MPPRQCPQRALPDAPHVPGKGPRPADPGAATDPDAWDGRAETLRVAGDYGWGIDLYNHGYYWEAHEAWEQLWKLAPADSTQRHFLQALIQFSAAALKARMGQTAACQRLANRALVHMEPVVQTHPDGYLGLDVQAFTRDFLAYSDAGQDRPVPILSLESLAAR